MNFTATAQNCAGTETWTWLASDTNAIGLGPNDSTASISWNICDSTSCPPKTIEVWALKAACSGDSNLVENRATITVSDARPQIAALNVAPTSQVPDTYPVCTLLNFSADVGGRTPFTYAWTIRNQSENVVASGSGSSLTWDTSGQVITDIFADGFESGDTTAWNGARAPVSTSTPSLVDEVMASGSASYSVGLVVNNSTGAPDNISRRITLVALGDLAFGGATPITATNLGTGQYRFIANTLNATSWRWEIEDPGNGTTSGCQFFTKCRILDFGSDDNDITVAWALPNTDGTYRVRVSANNCLTVANPISAEISVNVTGIPTSAPPVATSFSIIGGTGGCSLSLNVMECVRNASIGFTVTHTGTASNYEFDWENDGTFEQSVTVGAGITHIYTSTGSRSPKVRARNGGGTPSAAIGLPWTLNIIN